MDKNFNQLLRSEFEDRVVKNRSYSLRRYARDLGISVSLLSQLVRNQRIIGKNTADKVLNRLGMVDDLRNEYMASLNQTRPKGLRALKVAQKYKEFANKDKIDDEIVGNWQCFAILNLMSTSDFRDEPSWIAKRLAISDTEVRRALEVLKMKDIIGVRDGKLVANVANLETLRGTPSDVIKKFHEDMLSKTSKAIRKVPFSMYDVTTVMVPFDIEKLGAAKELISEFTAKMDHLFSSDKADEVYALNVQLVPLTVPKHKDS